MERERRDKRHQRHTEKHLHFMFVLLFKSSALAHFIFFCVGLLFYFFFLLLTSSSSRSSAIANLCAHPSQVDLFGLETLLGQSVEEK